MVEVGGRSGEPPSPGAVDQIECVELSEGEPPGAGPRREGPAAVAPVKVGDGLRAGAATAGAWGWCCGGTLPWKSC